MNEPSLNDFLSIFVFLFPSRIEEYWDPILTGLDPIIVTRQVPAIHIFLTLDDVEPKTPGYQKANVPTSFWPEPAPKQQKKDEDYAYKNKKNFNGNSRNNNQHRSNNSRPQNNQQSSSGQSKNRNQNNKAKRDSAPTAGSSAAPPQEATTS